MEGRRQTSARQAPRRWAQALLRPKIGPAQEGVRSCEGGATEVELLHSTLEISIMKTYATLLAGVLGAMTFALPAVAADDAVKASMKQADSSYDMTKKQAKADEKAAKAQCDTMSGDAKSQCKKDAEATYKKTMADAEAAHDKAKADYKAAK
jgi:hypothetical protein